MRAACVKGKQHAIKRSSVYKGTQSSYFVYSTLNIALGAIVCDKVKALFPRYHFKNYIRL